jgi:predicted dienelactone hydrolase
MHLPSEPPALQVPRRQRSTRKSQHKVRAVLLIESGRSASFGSYLTTGLREFVNKSLPGSVLI